MAAKEGDIQGIHGCSGRQVGKLWAPEQSLQRRVAHLLVEDAGQNLRNQGAGISAIVLAPGGCALLGKKTDASAGPVLVHALRWASRAKNVVGMSDFWGTTVAAKRGAGAVLGARAVVTGSISMACCTSPSSK